MKSKALRYGSRIYPPHDRGRTFISRIAPAALTVCFMLATVPVYSSSGIDITQASFTERTVSTEEYTLDTRALDFHPDGSRFYIVGRSTGNVVEFELSEPWEIESAEYVDEFDVSDDFETETQGNNASHGVNIHPDGTYLYVWNRVEIWQYELTTEWDVTTAERSGYNDLSDIATRGHDIAFTPDGDTLFVDDRDDQMVYQFSLETPWDIETTSLEYELDISGEEDAVRGTEFSEDGTQMFLMDTGRREVLQYDLDEAWQISSAEFVDSFNVTLQSRNPRGLALRGDGSGMYVVDSNNDEVMYYEFGEE